MSPRQHAVAALNAMEERGTWMAKNRQYEIEILEHEISLAVEAMRSRCAKVAEEHAAKDKDCWCWKVIPGQILREA